MFNKRNLRVGPPSTGTSITPSGYKGPRANKFLRGVQSNAHVNRSKPGIHAKSRHKAQKWESLKSLVKLGALGLAVANTDKIIYCLERILPGMAALLSYKAIPEHLLVSPSIDAALSTAIQCSLGFQQDNSQFNYQFDPTDNIENINNFNYQNYPIETTPSNHQEDIGSQSIPDSSFTPIQPGTAFPETVRPDTPQVDLSKILEKFQNVPSQDMQNVSAPSNFMEMMGALKAEPSSQGGERSIMVSSVPLSKEERKARAKMLRKLYGWSYRAIARDQGIGTGTAFRWVNEE